ncbi:MAG TPA: PilZ domain-containing protein [Allosphingosinicella sp.]|jgi:hypothetical protein
MATLAQRLSFEGVQPVPSCIVEQRSEPRHEGVVETSILHFRGAAYNVPVVNISSRGTMIESDLEPRLGESVIIRFDGCTPIHAFVRWVRDGRIGLNFGCEMILSAQ